MALDFDGSADAMFKTSSLSEAAGTFTFHCKYNPDTTSSGTQTIFSMRQDYVGSVSAGSGHYIHVYQNGISVTLEIGAATGKKTAAVYSATVSAILSAGSWHAITATQDTLSSRAMYVDGSSSTDSNTFNAVNAMTNLSIGARLTAATPTFATHMNGKIADVAMIWSGSGGSAGIFSKQHDMMRYTEAKFMPFPWDMLFPLWNSTANYYNSIGVNSVRAVNSTGGQTTYAHPTMIFKRSRRGDSTPIFPSGDFAMMMHHF